MVIQRVASLPPQPYSQANSNSNSNALTKDVLYIGSAVPLETSEGLDAIQQPLRSRYPVHDEESIQGILSTVTITPTGVQLRYKSDTSQVIFFPFSSLSLCAAVRCVKSTNELTNEVTSRFVSLTQAATDGVVADRPAIFTTITRRTKGRQVLECHGFITVTPKDAMDLVQWTSAYDKRYKQGGVGPVGGIGAGESIRMANGGGVSSASMVMPHSNGAHHDFHRAADTSFPAAADSTSLLPDFPINLVTAEPVVQTASQEFYNEVPKEGYFYSTKKAQVKKFSLHKFANGETEGGAANFENFELNGGGASMSAAKSHQNLVERAEYAGSHYSLPVTSHPHPHPVPHPQPILHPQPIPLHHPQPHYLPPPPPPQPARHMVPVPYGMQPPPPNMMRPVLVRGPPPPQRVLAPPPMAVAPPPPSVMYVRPRYFAPPPPPPAAFMRAQPMPIFVPPPPGVMFNGGGRPPFMRTLSRKGRSQRRHSSHSSSSRSSSPSPERNKTKGKKKHHTTTTRQTHHVHSHAHVHEDSSNTSPRPVTPPTDYDTALPRSARTSRKEDHVQRQQSYLREMNGPHQGAMTIWPSHKKSSKHQQQQGYYMMYGGPTLPRARSVPPHPDVVEYSSKHDKKHKTKNSSKKSKGKNKKNENHIELGEDAEQIAMRNNNGMTPGNFEAQPGYERSFSRSAAERAFSKSLAAETKKTDRGDAFNAYRMNQNGAPDTDFPFMY